MNAVLAGASVYAWNSQSTWDAQMQLYDESVGLYSLDEQYKSTSRGPGASTWVFAQKTDDQVQKWLSSSVSASRTAAAYKDDSRYIFGSEEFLDHDEQTGLTDRLNLALSGGVEDLDDDHKVKPDVSGRIKGSYSRNPMPNGQLYSLSASTNGSFGFDVLPKNYSKRDFNVSGSGSVTASQSAAPSEADQMTRESLSASGSLNSRIKITRRWGSSFESSVGYSDWVGNYSKGTELTSDFSLSAQYNPKNRDVESDRLEDQQPLLKNVKFGLGGDLEQNDERYIAIDQTISNATRRLYAKASTSTNEKQDWSAYAGIKPRWNWREGTNNDSYPSLSSWLGCEYTPAFQSFSFQFSHYAMTDPHMRYVHTDPTGSYYYPEGVYSSRSQQVDLTLSADLAPIERLGTEFSVSGTQIWTEGDMSPTDDRSLSASGSIDWLVSRRRPYLTLSLSADWNYGDSLSEQVPTTDTKNSDWSVSFALSTDYWRLRK